MDFLFFACYVVVLTLACYFAMRPILKARKKYGKSEFLFLGKFKFVGGLNLPEGVPCNVFCLKSRVVFESSGQEFNLPVDKIIDVSVMTSTEIQKQYVSSIGGAVAGAMLLGPIGAVIGGAANKRSIKLKTKYLIFNYSTNEGIKFVLFDTENKISLAKRFERKFRSLKKQENIKTDL